MPSDAYIKYHTAWVGKLCPRCGQQLTTGHGWLFREPSPTLHLPDTRKPFGDVFLHDKREDCVVLASSQI
jgi:hypothetical protein